MTKYKKLSNLNEIFGHPKGLFILFFTEMWERFSYYGMRALLILFLVSNTDNKGLGWSNTDAITVYGFYGMMVYLMCIIGGFISDKYIGLKKSILIGCIFQCLGHFLLALTISSIWPFFLGLFLLTIGCGLIKPNISTMVGSLYDKKNEKKRENGFTIFYMGINLGALFSPIIIGWIGEIYGWHYGFGTAGIGMLFSIITFLLGQKYLNKTSYESKKKSDTKLYDIKKIIKEFSEKEKNRLLVLFFVFMALCVFFTAFEQSAGLLNLYTKNYTNRNIFNIEIPTSMFQSLNPFFVIIFAPLISSFWSAIDKNYKTISPIYKVGIGNIIISIGFLFMICSALEKRYEFPEQASMYWIIGTYVFHTLGELCLAPVSMAFVIKLSPKKITSLMMGLYFSIFGISNLLSAEIGKMSEHLSDLTIFQIIFTMEILSGIILIFLVKN